MVSSQELDDFCQVLISALQAMRKANELPPYMSSKARDVNAGFIQKNLLEKIESGAILMNFMNASMRSKICSVDELKTKNEIFALVDEMRPFIDRIKDGSFKLILDRFYAAHELAIKLDEILAEIQENERVKQLSKANNA